MMFSSPSCAEGLQERTGQLCRETSAISPLGLQPPQERLPLAFGTQTGASSEPSLEKTSLITQKRDRRFARTKYGFKEKPLLRADSSFSSLPHLHPGEEVPEETPLSRHVSLDLHPHPKAKPLASPILNSQNTNYSNYLDNPHASFPDHSNKKKISPLAQRYLTSPVIFNLYIL